MTRQTTAAAPRPGSLPLLISLVGAPLAWAIQFGVNYALVYFVCARAPMLPMHLVSIAALVGAAGATYVAWRTWSRTHLMPLNTPADTRIAFLAQAGLILSGLFLLLSLLTAVTPIVLSPCRL